MKRRFPFALLSAAVVIAMSAFLGGSIAAPLSSGALGFPHAQPSALIKVQTACGWTYSCTNLGNGSGPQQVQIYGPVNVYTNTDVKEPEIWRVPEGAWPWDGRGGDQNFRGWGCGGYPCDERCGAFCWFRRIRNGYCGHGCDAYREHVMFQPINGNLRPFVYRSDGDCGYGSSNGSQYGCRGSQGWSRYGYGYGSGQAPGGYGYGYGRPGGYRYGYGRTRYGYGYGSGQGGYSQTSVQDGYGSPANDRYGQPPAGYSQNAPQGYGAPAPNGERFIDRLRRYVYGTPGREAPRDTGAVRNNGAARFERPSNDLTPLRRFNGPKYPPNADGGSKSYGEPK